MISSEVQRTLVKSPPELWSELSDPAALARHLGELGEIKITKVEPERTVEWEAEAVTGKVELKPSGWGTKVTLSVTQAPPEGSREEQSEPEDAVMEQDEATEETVIEPPPATDEQTVLEPSDIAVEPIVALQPATRKSFFARLFRRKARIASESVPTPEPDHLTPAEPAPTVAAEATIEPESTADENMTMIEPAATDAPARTDDEEPATEPANPSAELMAAEEALEAQTTELLKLVLDRLGAAHHRPFSRA